MITKPLLAVNAKPEKIKWPVLVTPKLDGIRCLVVDGKCMSRSFKPIPNTFVRTTIESDLGHLTLDGELMLNIPTPFNEISSNIMRENGTPNFTYHVFDVIGPKGLSEPYEERMENLSGLQLPAYVVKVLPSLISNSSLLEKAESSAIEQGYEGLMARQPKSVYKCGRSSVNEGILLKIKQFEDAEAEVIGVEELMSNQNEATKDAFGRTERSSHKENMVPMGTLGALILRDLVSGVEFKCGTGYSQATRALIWADKDVVGKIVTYTKQPSGEHEKPRFPVFKGFRSRDDF